MHAEDPHYQEIMALRAEVAELKQSVADLVEAWRAAKGFLSVIKFVAGLASAIAIIWGVVLHGRPQ